MEANGWPRLSIVVADYLPNTSANWLSVSFGNVVIKRTF